MTVLGFVMIAVAAWRISFFLSNEAGPFGIATRFRTAFGITHDADGAVESFPSRFPANAIVCMWCISLYVGVVLYVSWLLIPPLVVLSAVWGAATLIHIWATKNV